MGVMGRGGYTATAILIGLLAALLHGFSAVPLWDPTTAVVVAGFVVIGPRLAPIAAPVYVATVLVFGPEGVPLVALALMGLAHVVVLFILAQVLRTQHLFRDGHLGGWPTVVAFAATSTVFAVLTAEIRFLVAEVLNNSDLTDLAAGFGRTVLTETLGIVTFTPAIVAVWHRLSSGERLEWPFSRQGLEMAVMGGVTAVTALFATQSTFDDRAPLLYLVIVPLIVLSARYRALGGALGVATVSFVVAMVVAKYAQQESILVDAGIFVAVMAIAGLSAGSAAEERHTSAQRLLRTLEADPDGKLLIDSTGTVLYANTAAGLLFGFATDEVEGVALDRFFETPITTLLDPHGSLDLSPDGPATGVWARGRDGVSFPADVRIATLPDGGYIASVRDVTEQERMNRELERLAMFDSLTGLPNRASLVESLPDVLARAHRVGHHVAVLFCDLDGFKAVNDMHGHPFGDRLLESIAERLRDALRPGDVLARLGGDEFVCVAEGVDGVRGAVIVAERLIEAVSKPIQIDDIRVNVGLSVGVALSASDSTPDRLLSHADSALYASKRGGRGRYTVFDEALARETRKRVVTAKAVQDGLNEDRFECWYQPIVDMNTGTLAGAEALLRWSHPEEGILPADSFIDVAEQSGLVLNLTSRVVRGVAQTAAQLDEGVRIWFNLSAIELAHSDIYTIVKREIEAAGCSPSALGVEITESCAEEVKDAAEKLRSLRELGLKVAIDDFGTGYSSLARLLSLPIDVVKIDKSLVQPLPDSDESEQVVSAVVQLAHRLGYQVTAEGVETAAQYEMLRGMNIDCGQGYLIGKPAPEILVPRPRPAKPDPSPRVRDLVGEKPKDETVVAVRP